MVESILLRRIGALGDVLNTTPVAKRLRIECPNATIHVHTQHIAAYENNPYIDGFYNPQARYDKIIDLTMAYETRRNLHQIEAYFEVAFGDRSGDKSIIFTYSKNNFRDLGEKVAVIHPARSWPSRTISSQLWEEVSNRLNSLGFSVYVTGTHVDQCPTSAYDLRGKFPLRHQAELIDAADIFICSDSGLATLAMATQTPMIVLTTITSARFWLTERNQVIEIPAAIECHGCGETQPASEFFACHRGDNACVETFRADEIVENAIRLISKPLVPKYLTLVNEGVQDGLSS